MNFAAGMFATLVAIILFAQHRFEARESALPYWIAAYWVFALRHTLQLFVPAGFYGGLFIPGFALLNAGLQLAGATALLGQRPRLGWLAALLAAEIAWIAFARAVDLAPPLRLLPVTTLYAAIMLGTVLQFARLARREPTLAATATACIFLLWAVIALVYPLWAGGPQAGAVGAALSMLGNMAVGILVLAVVLGRRRLRSERTAEELAAAKSRLESLVGSASDWVWEIDAAFRYTFLSPRFAEITGSPPAAMLGRRWDALWMSDPQNERPWSEFQAVLERGRPFRSFRYPAHGSGGAMVLSVSGEPVRDPAGRLLGYRGTGRDISREAAVGAILEVFAGDAGHRVGPAYFQSLVRTIAATLNVDMALIASLATDADGRRIARTLAFLADGTIIGNMEYPLAGTSCEQVSIAAPLILARGASARFPADGFLRDNRIEGYAGIGLGAGPQGPLGLLAVLSRQPLGDVATIDAVLNAIAPRAAAELERQLADERLRESEARFREVIDNLPAALGARDAEGRFIFVNRRYEEFNQVRAADLVGRPIEAFIGPLGDAAMVAAYQRVDRQVFATGETITSEVMRPDRPADGEPTAYIVSRFPIRDSHGAIVAVGSVSIDITARKKAEDALRQSEARFRAVIDNMPLAITARDLEGRHVFANPAYEAVSGHSAGELIGRTPDELFDLPRDVLFRIDQFDKVVIDTDSATVHEIERSDARRGGAKSRFLVNRFPIRDAAGTLVAVGSVGTDITELKRIERELRASEARFRAVIEHMPLCFAVRDLAGRFVVTNPTYDTVAGLQPGEALGRRLHDIMGPMGGEEVVRVAAQGDAKVIETGLPYTQQLRRPDRRRGDMICDFLVTRFPIRDADDRLVAVGSVALDITDEKRANEDRDRSEALLRTVIENLPVGFLLRTSERRIAVANQAFADLAGLPLDRIVGSSVDALRDALPDKRLFDSAVLGPGRLERAPMPHTSQHVGPDPRDTTREIALSLIRFRLPEGNADQSTYGIIVQNITEAWMLSRERDARERALAASEARFRAVISNIPFGFCLRDREGRFVFVNPAYEAMVGLAAREIIGRTPDEVAPRLRSPAIFRHWHADDAAVLGGAQPVSEEHETPDPVDPGRTLSAAVVQFPVPEHEGVSTGLGTLAIDVSSRRRMQQAIAEREAELRRVLAALDMAREGIAVEEADGRVLYANRVARALIAPEGGPLALLQSRGLRDRLTRHGQWSGELSIDRPEGRPRDVAVDCVALVDGTVVTVLDDITEEKAQRQQNEALERRLRRSEKMEALGRLAGGIAHDFNNLLGAIVGFASFIAEDAEPGERAHVFAERILAASDRAKGIVREVLAFSRPADPQRQRLALGGHLVETMDILRPALPPAIDVRLDIRDPEITVEADPSQLTQVVMNLVLNAADAMEGRGGTIEVSNLLVDAGIAALTPHMPAAAQGGMDPEVEVLPDGALRCVIGQVPRGATAVIRIADRGHGIARETLEKIFDPFFTTKTKGKGTGLGLPVVHSIVLAHSGAIVVRTRQNSGTIFDVMLPAAAGAAMASGASLHALPMAGRGRILVVDDDHDFGDMVGIALRRAGYDATVMDDPLRALDLVGDDPTVWDLVITDHTMPGLTGTQLIERLAVLQPDLPCVLCSGFGADLNENAASAAGASAFLAKPIDIAALIGEVGRLIAQSQAA